MDWHNECKTYHNIGVESLTKFGRTPFVFNVYHSEGADPLSIISANGLDDELRFKIRVMNSVFTKLQPAAVLMQSDIWSANSKRLAEYFKLPSDLPADKFQEEYQRIIKQYGSLGNLPEEARSESLFTMVKGPKIGTIATLTMYHRDHGNKVVIEGEEFRNDPLWISYLIPDWWAHTIQ